MTVNEYTTISGITVSASNNALVTAQLARTQRILEDLLGYTLTPADVNTNLYNELGKTSTECSCPDVDVADLLPPDAVVTAYRQYPYNELDDYFYIDPYSDINVVKLVFNDITLKTYDDLDLRQVTERYGVKRYLERFVSDTVLGDCGGALQLAVDAVWLWASSIPNDLLQVQAEMVTYYSNLKNDIKSESIGPHSYTKADNTPPEMKAHNLNVIRRYAGPYGRINRNITI